MLISKKSNFLYLYAFSLFIITALYGFLLRWNFTFPSSLIDFHSVLQSHSHVAFLGWGYIATIALIKSYVIDENLIKNKVYKITIFIIIITVTLMLISFPLSGYKVFSIVLLSVFGITSYVLSFRILKDLKGESIPIKLIRYGIYYYLLSSLATWFLAGVIVTQGKTELYYNTVYFYLHFLYNGYFVFVLFGLLIYYFEKQNISISKSLLKNFFWFLNIACIPAYALSILWSNVSIVFNYVGFIASILQLISLFFLLKIVKNIIVKYKWNRLPKFLFQFSIMAYCLKIISQIASSIPFIVDKSLALKHFFIIGYLHLFTLGFMSVLLFLILIELKIIKMNKLSSKVGIITFLIGILTTEIMLFLQGSFFLFKMPHIKSYNLLVLIFSGFIILGLIIIYINQFRRKRLIK